MFVLDEREQVSRAQDDEVVDDDDAGLDDDDENVNEFNVLQLCLMYF
jgi:hypothetical protein